ncbi:hypothetical protein [Massilia niastensis]|uniref:hypothetical protein n=1 Tax=Massilia niastensis TaxID=544911 RepID=UPI00036D3E6A|nr:hypothetical protein [Massilia niastensis]
MPCPVPAQPASDLAEARARLLEAETRQAIAEAERAELLARLPPAQSKPLAGRVDTREFGAAGLARAFDLALQLASEVCAVLPPDRTTVVYDPATAQGVVAARSVDAALFRLADELAARNRELARYIESHTPPGSSAGALPLAWLATPPATLRAVADLAALFKGDVSAAGIGYGEGARALFASALARACPERLAGLGGGYLGELDWTRHERLLGRVRALGGHRANLAQHIATLDRLAAGAKGDLKKELAAVGNAAEAQLKAVDTFIESLKAGEASEKSPLFTAARYLGQAERSLDALVLDADLRLEGMSIVRDNLFTGQRLGLSGVAFLWYRLHETDGRLVRADALRRISAPIEVDLRGGEAGDGFWSGASGQSRSLPD